MLLQEVGLNGSIFSVKINSLVCLVFLAFFISSCLRKETNPVPQSSDSAFFDPNNWGNKLYFVKDTLFTTSGPYEENWIRLEKPVEWIKGVDGLSRLRIEVYRSDSLQEPYNFNFIENMLVFRDLNQAQIDFGNTRFVNLIFPAAKNKIWDGNRFNAMGPEFYTYINCDTVVKIGNLIFPGTFVVLKNEVNNYLSQKKSLEMYSINYGSIYRYDKSIVSDGVQILTDSSHIYSTSFTGFVSDSIVTAWLEN